MSCVKINAQTTFWKKLVQNHFMIYQLYPWTLTNDHQILPIWYIATKRYQPPPSSLSLLCLSEMNQL